MFFTQTYPFDAQDEAAFIRPQLEALMDVFGRMILIPRFADGRRDTMPEGVETDESLTKLIRRRRAPWRMVVDAARSSAFWSDLTRYPVVARSPTGLRRLTRASAESSTVKTWLDNRLESEDLIDRDVVAYSFWSDSSAIGIALASSPRLTRAARVNGFDLFLERHRPPFLPGRNVLSRNLDHVFAASDFARRYFIATYPAAAATSDVAYLGVDDPGRVASGSGDDRFVLVSCAGIVQGKRVDRIAAAVSALAAMRPDVSFEWHHFGGGPDEAAVEAALGSKPSNAETTLHGPTDRPVIMSFYASHPVDVIVNLSASEGGPPVALMEAASYGIPAVATAVGGNPEIVSGSTGFLVPVDCPASETARAIARLVDDRTEARRLRSASREMWRTRFQASTNARAFAAALGRLQPTSRPAIGSRVRPDDGPS